MSVLPSDIVVYGSANMQEADTGTQGGAISTSKRVVFDDISPTGTLQVVSSAAGDTDNGTSQREVTVTGRNAAGEIITEVIGLDATTGLTPVAGLSSFERLLKAVKGGSLTYAGDVALEESTAETTGTAQSGAAATTSVMAKITLAAAESSTDDAFNNMVLRITGGTGSGQIRRIVDYTGATKEAFVDRDWGVVPDATSVYRVSQGMVFEKSIGGAEITEVRRIFYNISADVAGGAARDFYEKIFFKNTHATLSLTAATIAEQADPSGKVTFGLASTLDDTGTSTNRVTAPASIVFDSTTKNVANSQNHTAGAAQGVWLKLTLAAGDAAQKTSYTLRESGTTV